MLLLPRKFIRLRNAHSVHETKLRLQHHFDASAGLATEKTAISKNADRKRQYPKNSKQNTSVLTKRKLKPFTSGAVYDDVNFVGNIHQQRFTMVKQDAEHNSFAPVISGHIKSSEYGSEITAHVKLPFQMIQLALAWYVITGIGAFVSIPLYFRDDSGSLFLFAPIVFFIVMVLLVQFGFAQGTYHIDQQLEKLFYAKTYRYNKK